jgi:hypothetical protein
MKILRTVSWVIFLLSLLVLSTFLRSDTEVSAPESPSKFEPAMWISIITATGSLISGVVTSVITLRRDRLDSMKAELELEKTRLEISRLQKDTEIELAKKQIELDQLRENRKK